MRLLVWILASFTWTTTTTSGFVVGPSRTVRVLHGRDGYSTRLHGNTKQPPVLIPEIKDISYGEESRQYRRTVFSHDDWRRFRSTDRFPVNLISMTKSGIYKNLAREVTLGTLIAAFVVVWNALAGGYVDLQGIQHEAVFSNLMLLGLPQAPFVLVSPALSLLLGKSDQSCKPNVVLCLLLKVGTNVSLRSSVV
jgi:Bestrophin, RFP-TM, chloride channel